MLDPLKANLCHSNPCVLTLSLAIRAPVWSCSLGLRFFGSSVVAMPHGCGILIVHLDEGAGSCWGLADANSESAASRPIISCAAWFILVKALQVGDRARGAHGDCRELRHVVCLVKRV